MIIASIPPPAVTGGGCVGAATIALRRTSRRRALFGGHSVKLPNFPFTKGAYPRFRPLVLPTAVAAAFNRIHKLGSLAQPSATRQTRPSRKTASTDRTFRTAFARLLMRCAAMARIGISPGGQPGQSQQGDSKQTFGPAPVNGSGKAGGRQMTTLRGRAPGFKFLTLVVDCTCSRWRRFSWAPRI